MHRRRLRIENLDRVASNVQVEIRNHKDGTERTAVSEPALDDVIGLDFVSITCPDLDQAKIQSTITWL